MPRGRGVGRVSAFGVLRLGGAWGVGGRAPGSLAGRGGVACLEGRGLNPLCREGGELGSLFGRVRGPVL